MSSVGVALNAGLVAAIVEALGDGPLIDALRDKDTKRQLDALAERAAELAGANDKREKGTHLHALSEIVDAHEPLPEGTSAADLLDMAAYELITEPFKMIGVEESVVVPELGVQGTFDRMAKYSGVLPDGREVVDENFIFDLKTGGSVEYGGLKMAAQLAAYSRGWRYDYTVFPTPPRLLTPDAKKNNPEFEKFKRTEFDAELAATAYAPIPPVNQDWGIILHLDSGTAAPELYWADLTIGWEACQLAGAIRRARSLTGKALQSFSKIEAKAALAA